MDPILPTGSKPIGAFDPINFNFTPVDIGVGRNGFPEKLGFDPQFIVPAQASETAREQGSDEPRPVHPSPRMAAAWPRIVKPRDGSALGSQFPGPGFRDTAVGVRLNPGLPDPAASKGRDHYPKQEHLRNGYKGELELANRIKWALPDEMILRYGMEEGFRGPDIISISPMGDISVWDSKWRGRPRSIGNSDAAHQSERSVKDALRDIRREVRHAADSGQLGPQAREKGLENADKGNFTINTIGTGYAHGGVVTCVRNENHADCWSN